MRSTASGSMTPASWWRSMSQAGSTAPRCARAPSSMAPLGAQRGPPPPPRGGGAGLGAPRACSPDPAETARAKDALAELHDHLTVRLGEPDRFDGATPDFLPLVLRVDDRSDDPVGD